LPFIKSWYNRIYGIQLIGAGKQQFEEKGLCVANKAELIEKPILDDCVVPIVGRKEGEPPQLFGTGFLVAPKRVVTAQHVVEEALKAKADLFVCESFRDSDSKPGAFQTPIKQVFDSKVLDLALLELYEWRSDHFLSVSAKYIPCNFSLMTMEFAQSRQVRTFEGKSRLVFDRAVRRGHIVRRTNDSFFMGQPTQEFLELSFPVLRGASGAPLMIDPEHLGKIIDPQRPDVVGVLVYNVERELQPAQVASTKFENGGEEKILYYLPSGIAIPGQRLCAFLDKAREQGFL